MQVQEPNACIQIPAWHDLGNKFNLSYFIYLLRLCRVLAASAWAVRCGMLAQLPRSTWDLSFPIRD